MSDGAPQGYVKLWRRTLTSRLLLYPVAWQVFGYCLLQAMWKEYEYKSQYGIIALKPGQFVTGRKKMAQNLVTSEAKIRTALKLLATMEIITIETTNHFSIITLINWDKYQNACDKDTNEITKSAPSVDQAFTTEEEGKKERTTLNRIEPKSKPPQDPYLLANTLGKYYDSWDTRNPGFSTVRDNAGARRAWEDKQGTPWTPKPQHPEDHR